MTVAHVLMGVLADGPAHGYDLKREHDERFPAAKPLPFGQVYATLGRLERDGWVEAVQTTRESGPDKTTYALTSQGRGVLEEWLGETEPAGPYVADELVRKVVTALHLGADAAGFLGRQRAIHLTRLRELTAAREDADDVDARIVVDHTISHLDADLRWMEAAAARVAADRKASR